MVVMRTDRPFLGITRAKNPRYVGKRAQVPIVLHCFVEEGRFRMVWRLVPYLTNHTVLVVLRN